MPDTLFQRYGGFAVVSRVVLDFYDRVLEDDQVGPFFEDVDMSRVIDHQTKFIASLLGGPAYFADDQLRQMHRHLDVASADFDALAALLAETLSDHGFAEEDVAVVIAEFDRRRGLIVKGVA